MTAGPSLIVSALVRHDGNLLLVEQQGPWDPAPSWMLPGGRVEAGETLIGALARELAEETGLRQIGTPRIAFIVDLTVPEGIYSALTFETDAAGTLQPADPDGFVRRADWVATDEALERLHGVAWYECEPIERFLSGEPHGAVYAIHRP